MGRAWARLGSMLQEGQRLKADGIDVVVGLVETHGRAGTARLIDGLEVVPRGPPPTMASPSRRWMSTRCWRAGPQVALVDELAHTNVPGSRNQKRYQDVQRAARRRHPRHQHDQRPAPREPVRYRRAPDRGQGARTPARCGAEPRPTRWSTSISRPRTCSVGSSWARSNPGPRAIGDGDVHPPCPAEPSAARRLPRSARQRHLQRPCECARNSSPA